MPTMTHLALHVNDISASIDFYERYCSMVVLHQRASGQQRIVWLTEKGRETEFIFVMMSGGAMVSLAKNDYTHFGFAVDSKAEVDAIAERAEKDGCLLWPPRQDDFPVGYYCGVKDPDGNNVEFSYGQPLGPGSKSISEIAM